MGKLLNLNELWIVQLVISPLWFLWSPYVPEDWRPWPEYWCTASILFVDCETNSPPKFDPRQSDPHDEMPFHAAVPTWVYRSAGWNKLPTVKMHHSIVWRNRWHSYWAASSDKTCISLSLMRHMFGWIMSAFNVCSMLYRVWQNTKICFPQSCFCIISGSLYDSVESNSNEFFRLG